MEEVKQNPVQEAKPERKKIMLSGIQPTGTFTLGNYLGAVRNWRQTQEDFQCAYFIADLHSLTVRQEPAKLRKQSIDAFALLLACGIDPAKSLVFIQSHVHAHAELGWILACYSMFGDLSRMTQFKDKSAKHADNVNAGLFTYPALMAADILLYQPDYVPVGEDQRQHLEFTRDVAVRMNSIYGSVFRVPDAYIVKAGAKIMSLQEPTKKMSKSDTNVNAFISILDEPNVIVNKFKRAVTDSETSVCYREGKDGINNLMSIYSVITGNTYEQIERDFAGKGYGDFKKAVGECVAEELRPVRERFAELTADKAALEAIYRKGAETASHVAERTLDKVKKKIGLLAK
ncbi:MAG: tryptophan--tRNA ligase [Pyramidobacter sp.]|nr:tryptophan--tRNA ligase [Pyramidobacter sp.]MBP3835593.1 tryptophan--tRNA ligase [Pyramidobacter sp.]MBQ4490987.1 tryptophan--tRNA ligase [Pyramidobacter sp.]MBR0108473.1 tryptophan--tRNA ligase [Pyramidobacter sp.]MBR1896373.1 tryptophan--tRNA ligase [Pyramidobacter sp.]